MIIRGKWALALLAVAAVSVTLNLFVFGFVAAKSRDWSKNETVIERVAGRYARGFPPELRAAVHERLRAREDEFTSALNGLREARRRAFELMRADTLDRPALEAALGEARRNFDAMQVLGHSAVVSGLENAPAALRAQIEARSHPHRWRKRN